MRRALLGLLAIGCHPSAGTDEPPPAPEHATAPIEPSPTAAPDRGAPPQHGAPSIPDVPALVVRSDQASGIEIYGAYLVDRSGERGTFTLWPHGSDCPGVTPPPHVVPGGGVLLLPAPVDAYPLDACEAAPLPAGEYVLRLDSGYGEQLYAAAPITLPLAGPVELDMTMHTEPPPCDETRARRAAHLALQAATASGMLPAGFARECDVERATCGALPLPDDAAPPSTCTITLHEGLLRIERAAGNDAPRWLTAWADPEVVYVRRPDVTRTSASRVRVEGELVVIAGLSDQHRHEHGGDAAQIRGARFVVDNPLDHPLKLRVRGVEFMTDSQCGMPERVRARPRPTEVTPTEVPPGTSEIAVGYAAQGAYQAHCDRFAKRVTFEVGGKRLAATAEHEVMRFEPLRHR